jgi:hypothetical protein
LKKGVVEHCSTMEFELGDMDSCSAVKLQFSILISGIG